METTTVSHADIWTSHPPLQEVMLLRRTSEIFLNYTDDHEVDEDMLTIVLQGGYWPEGPVPGNTRRFMKYDLFSKFDTVASRKKNKRHRVLSCENTLWPPFS